MSPRGTQDARSTPRAGALASPELQPFVDQVRGFADLIEAERTVIAAKRADIERIKAEHAAEHATAHEGKV